MKRAIMTKEKTGASRPGKAATTSPKSPESGGKTPGNLAPQDNPTPQPAAAKTTFLTLPPELRNRIYTLALVPLPGWPIALRAGQNHLHRGQKTKKLSWRRESWREPPLLKVSREVRAEALPLYYGSNCFVVDVFMEDLGDAGEWVRSVVRGCGGREGVFLSLGFVVHGEAWAKLQAFRPWVQVLREVGPRLARARGKEVRAVDVGVGELQAPTFEMSRHTGRFIREAFEAVVGLASRARGEGWSEGWLDWEFAALVERLWESEGGVAAAKAGREKVARGRKAARRAGEDGA